MIKKILGIMIAAVMILSVSGIMGCGNFSLAYYKATARTEIDAYAATKVESDFCFRLQMILCYNEICKVVFFYSFTSA